MNSDKMSRSHTWNEHCNYTQLLVGNISTSFGTRHFYTQHTDSNFSKKTTTLRCRQSVVVLTI